MLDWMEIVDIKPHMPRKKYHAFCSLHRNKKTAIHTTINGQGAVSRLLSSVDKGKRR